jgi:hypothetical protein
MKEFHAASLFNVCEVLSTWSGYGNNEGELSDEFRADNLIKLRSYREPLLDLGMSASRASLDRLIKILEVEKCKWASLSGASAEFLGRLHDETDDRTFFSLNLRETEYFTKPVLGWESPVARFPEILGDVEEARKCFALSRYSGAVFHSIQIIESGLITLGTYLRVTDPKSGWTAVSGALEKVIKKEHKNRGLFERKNFAFLEQMHGTVAGLKNAWRNKISHAHGKLVLMTTDFSPDVAEEILISSRSFMRRLAEGLPPAKPKKGAP